jgi:PKD repeat protein
MGGIAMKRIARIVVLVGAAASLVFAGPDARAVISEPPPTEPPLAPPPIPALPAAGETTPPAAMIVDPVQPAAECGGWYLQSSYAGRWPTGSTWWEFRCTYTYPEPFVGATNADWGGSYDWVDHFYWDGSNAIFYGESFFDGYWDSMITGSGCSYWWDAPTSRWYLIECPVEQPSNNAPTASASFVCSGLSCTFDGSGSRDSDGTIATYEWVFGDGTTASGVAAQHSYAQPGTYTVTLTVTDDRGGWNRDSRTVAVTASNAAPTAAFTINCSGLSCAFVGAGSNDTDGTVVSYGWDFGDGTSGSGENVSHSYGGAGSYTVSLTVADNGGATGSDSKTFNPMSLSARGYKRNGLQKADLSWTGPSGTSFELYRSGLKIATIQTTTYTDDINTKGSASYTYRVCAVGAALCSNEVAVTF